MKSTQCAILNTNETRYKEKGQREDERTEGWNMKEMIRPQSKLKVGHAVEWLERALGDTPEGWGLETRWAECISSVDPILAAAPGPVFDNSVGLSPRANYFPFSL
jgi:hypothetical protein